MSYSLINVINVFVRLLLEINFGLVGTMSSYRKFYRILVSSINVINMIVTWNFHCLVGLPKKLLHIDSILQDIVKYCLINVIMTIVTWINILHSGQTQNAYAA